MPPIRKRKVADVVASNADPIDGESPQELLEIEEEQQFLSNKKQCSNDNDNDNDNPKKRETWESMLERLMVYKSVKGDCRVPRAYKQDPKLAKWVDKQRQKNKAQHRNTLTKEQRAKLDALDFIWVARKPYVNWEDMLVRLQNYKQEHGNCLVPNLFPRDPSLGRWVLNQRSRRDELTPLRESKLEEIGFKWWVYDAWLEMYNRLVSYKEKQGHCVVPRSFKDDPKLANWVNRQRKRNEKEKMEPERKLLLDELGFVWNADTEDILHLKKEEMWNGMLERLASSYNSQHPPNNGSHYLLDGKLAQWVNYQRKRKRKLTDTQRGQLDELGFSWVAVPVVPKGERAGETQKGS